jgi:hypothetical protein
MPTVLQVDGERCEGFWLSGPTSRPAHQCNILELLFYNVDGWLRPAVQLN